jgi:acetate kinase
MARNLLLTCNAGSSSVKFGVYVNDSTTAKRAGEVDVDLQKHTLTFHQIGQMRVHEAPLTPTAADDMTELTGEVLNLLSLRFDIAAMQAVGHRVVHGGDHFREAVIVDLDTEVQIEALVPLAPLHEPQALRLVRAVRSHLPDINQTASFDTSFHLTNADHVRRLAIPRDLHDAGIKRYGFHGLSYTSIARQLASFAPEISYRRVVVAHLGSGCSLCGLENGISRDTSMGFSTLDGVPMATRCGALDAGVLLNLLREQERTPAEVEDLLYNKSGLLGVSGISGDTRDLLESQDPRAAEALDLFAFRIAGEASRIANTLGGLDAFVFTAGVGEHQPRIRAAIATHLAWLGVRLDTEANAAGRQLLSSPASGVMTFLIHTDEGQVIADDTRELLMRLERK